MATPVGTATATSTGTAARRVTSESSTSTAPARPAKGTPARVREYARRGPAGERAHEGGRAQADEADRSGEGDGRRGEQRREYDDRDPGGADRDAEAAGVVAERQGVHAAGEEQQSGEPDEADGRHLHDAVEPVLGDAALVPLEEALHPLGEEQEQPFGDGGEAEGEGTAGEHEPDASRAQARQSEHDGRRHEPADERDTGGGEQRE
ncbi:hypothetical protein SSPO_094400 [Streptomyces antimycoticus]|uniref:Uncharacterized protein n=1 Tax=Streptomyces antimycoticus TaxID=68175 RepID=A0A499UZT7_9ACTN|nr:hypothetical protein SSPO_094400 [Streptomyces antimycoticus]